MVTSFRLTGIGLLILIVVLAGCNEKTPDRDHIPVLRQTLLNLQEAVRIQDRYALDTLVTGSQSKRTRVIDSLISFVYGERGTLAFERFGDYDIFYNRSLANIDCFIMDKTGSRDRPVALLFVLDDNRWLLKGIAPGLAVRPDSIDEQLLQSDSIQ
jgi:hypothetical protein